jgi:hypothetical protein
VVAQLAELEIDSISLNPDTVLKTAQHVPEVERRLGRAARSPDGMRVHVATRG